MAQPLTLTRLETELCKFRKIASNSYEYLFKNEPILTITHAELVELHPDLPRLLQYMGEQKYAVSEANISLYFCMTLMHWAGQTFSLTVKNPVRLHTFIPIHIEKIENNLLTMSVYHLSLHEDYIDKKQIVGSVTPKNRILTQKSLDQTYPGGFDRLKVAHALGLSGDAIRQAPCMEKAVPIATCLPQLN